MCNFPDELPDFNLQMLWVHSLLWGCLSATKSVILCEKWRTKFPTHRHSYQPLTCCIGLQQFSGTLYWGIKTLWSQFRFFRNGACMKRALLHMKGRDTLWTLYTFACGALIPSHCCSSVLLCTPLSSCCAELHGRVYLLVCLQQPRRC